jgi:hypothetical protein
MVKDPEIPQSNQFLSDIATMIDQFPGINYIINKNYEIISYSTESWNKSAQNSGGDLLLEDKLLNHSIFDFMIGERVKKFYLKAYELIFNKDKEQIKIESLDDAPDMLRDNVIYLTPIIEPTTEEVIGVLHHSLIIKTRERTNLDSELLNQYHPSQFSEICSICKFVKIVSEDNNPEWIEPARFFQLGGSSSIELDHTICPDCSNILDDFI